MMYDSEVKLDFLFPVKILDGVPKIGVYLFFSLLRLVCGFGAFVEFNMNHIFTVIQPDI